MTLSIRILLLSILIFASKMFFSQNVGIGTTNPTTTFHVVKPAGVLDPLRIEGLRLTNTRSHILVVDTTSGIVKHISFDSLSMLIADSINTDNQNLSISNDTLFIEDGNWVIIKHPTDTNLIDSLILNLSDSLFHLMKDSMYVYISDSLLKDTTWINQLDSLLISKSDTLYFNDTTYTIIRDSLLGDTLFLDSLLVLLRDSINTDDQNLTVAAGGINNSIIDIETGSDVTIAGGANISVTESGSTITISSSGGSTDDQNLTVGSGGSNSSIIDIETGSDITIAGGSDITVTESGSTITISYTGAGGTIIWHNVGAAGKPAFQNSWQNSSTTSDYNLQYGKSGNVVWIRGGLNLFGSTNTYLTVFNIPSAYRPSKDTEFFVNTLGSSDRVIKILANGNVQAFDSSGAGGPTFEISYRVD